VILEPDDFLAYCQQQGWTAKGTKERALYSIARSSAKKLN